MMLKSKDGNNNFSNNIVLANIFSFILISCLMYFLLHFFFPREWYWIVALLYLLLFAVTGCVLTIKRKIENFYTILDQNRLSFLETVFVIGTPVIFSLLLSPFTNIPFVFYFLVFGIISLFHPFLTEKLAKIILNVNRVIKLRNSNQIIENLMPWVFSIVFVLGAFIYALHQNHDVLQLPFDDPALKGYNTLIEGYKSTGLWFIKPVAVSQNFPMGFGRYEENLFELGSYILKAILVKYNISYVGLLYFGLLLFAFVVGITKNDPLGFIVISGALLFTLPTTLIRNTEIVLLGIPFFALIPSFADSKSLSTTLWYMLFCGILAGAIGLVRGSSGFSFFVAAIFLSIIFVGYKHRKIKLVPVIILSIIFGYLLVGVGLKGLLWHRDNRLNIVAPVVDNFNTHPQWFPLLGGVGGGYPPDKFPPYQNSLDLAFWDPVILNITFNYHPLSFNAYQAMDFVTAIGTRPSFFNTVADIGARYVYFDYLRNHLFEYLYNTILKIFSFVDLSFQDILSNKDGWLTGVVGLFIYGGVSKISSRFLINYESNKKPYVKHKLEDLLIACLVLGIISSIPIIMTSPMYFSVRGEPESIFRPLFYALIYIYLIDLPFSLGNMIR